MAATLALIWAMSEGGMFFTNCRARHLEGTVVRWTSGSLVLPCSHPYPVLAPFAPQEKATPLNRALAIHRGAATLVSLGGGPSHSVPFHLENLTFKVLLRRTVPPRPSSQPATLPCRPPARTRM